MIAHQGLFVTYSNFVVSGLWFLDVVLAWLGGDRGRGPTAILALHRLTWLYVLVSFVISSITFSKNNTILVMGWVMVGVVALSVLIRVFGRRPRAATTEP